MLNVYGITGVYVPIGLQILRLRSISVNKQDPILGQQPMIDLSLL